MTLTELETQIKNAASTQNESAIADIFEELAKENSFYIIPDPSSTSGSTISSSSLIESKSFRPFIGSIPKSDFSFLRIFSHKECAVEFADNNKIPEDMVVEISTTETTQLAKYWFVRGIKGFILNDGGVWVTISFTDYLKVVFSNVIECPSMFNDEYAQCMEFFLYSSLPYYTHSSENEIKIDHEETLDSSSFSILQIDTFPDNTLIVLGENTTTTKEHLQSAFLDLTDPEKATSGLEDDFHITYVDMNFREDALEDGAEEPERQEDQDEDQAPLMGVIPAGSCDSEGAVDGSKVSFIEEVKKRAANFKFNMKFFLKLGFAVLLILLLVLFFVNKITNSTTKFEKEIKAEEYSNALVLYKENTDKGFRGKANDFLVKEVDSTYSSYVSEKLSAEEAQKKLQAYCAFDDVQEYASGVYGEAAALEKSRLAFKKGEDEYKQSNMVSALTYWDQVVEADEVDKKNIDKYISDNGDSIKNTALIEVKKLSDINETEAANDALIIIQKFFPDDRAVNAVIENTVGVNGGGVASNETGDDEFFESDSLNLEKPIIIKRTSVMQDYMNGCVNLQIVWVNQSGKTISSVTFYVEPVGFLGSSIKEAPDGYLTFAATDNGPYANGEGTPSSSWMWYGAWKDTPVNSVHLLKVEIEYEDGSTTSILDEATLNSIQS